MRHGRLDLPDLTVRAYNAEIKEGDGFLGDRASKRGFQAVLDDWRERLHDEDPFGDKPALDIGRRKLDKILAGGDPRAAGLILAAVEDFAAALARVTQRLLETDDWRGVERISVGGGMRASRIGELSIGRAWTVLQAAGIETELQPIRHHPDEAGLVGAAYLVPLEELRGYDSLLAVDIGGTKFRAGLVELNLDKAPDRSAARVSAVQMWHHRDDEPTRDEAVERLCAMLGKLLDKGKRVAPVIGIGCPGVIKPDGQVEKGAQNLPDGWEDEGFNLAERIAGALPRIGEQHTQVILHNDGVLQGLSEIPCMQGVRRWGILTIGTGLGNASFEGRG